MHYSTQRHLLLRLCGHGQVVDGCRQCRLNSLAIHAAHIQALHSCTKSHVASQNECGCESLYEPLPRPCTNTVHVQGLSMSKSQRISNKTKCSGQLCSSPSHPRANVDMVSLQKVSTCDNPYNPYQLRQANPLHGMSARSSTRISAPSPIPG